MPIYYDAHPVTGETVPAYAVRKGGACLAEALNAGRATHTRDARHRVSSERRTPDAVPLVAGQPAKARR